jgi:glutaredoxin
VLLGGGSLLAFLTKTNVLSPVSKEDRETVEMQKFQKNNYKKSSNVLGEKGALARVYVYSDLRCPYCKITNNMLNKLPDDFKHVEIIHVNYPLDNSCNKYVPHPVHPEACELSKIALAARKQGNYWGMVNELFEANEVNLKEISEKLNLDYETLKKDAKSKEIEKELLSEIELSYSNGINISPLRLMQPYKDSFSTVNTSLSSFCVGKSIFSNPESASMFILFSSKTSHCPEVFCAAQSLVFSLCFND